MDSRRKKFIAKSNWPSRKMKDYEEWNDFSSQEDFNLEDNQLPLESIPEPEYDEDEVFLSWYDSDLNLIIDDNFIAASPLHQGGFSYLQAGARATFGFFSGKVCFEVKVLQCCKLSLTKGHLNTHLLRVGWSPRKASLGLGSDHKSYGYDSAGRVSTLGEIVDYGKIFSTGDVVGAYLDIGADKISISFTVNGEDMGVAYDIPQSVVQKEPLFPHILTKNISYECNFGKEKPWFPPKEGYTFVANVGKEHRIAGPRRPKSQSDCEVILMVGLPKSGKTSWVNEFREKNPGMYYVIDSNALIDNVELMSPKREAIILRNTRVLGKLLGIAMDRRRNYILDQYNVVRAEQVWKLGFFRNYKRRIVTVVLPDEELKKRNKTFNGDDPPWMLKLKAKFLLPMMSCPKISAVADKVDYVGLPLKEALPLVKRYNREAWREGYMPYKNFRIPPQMYKEQNLNTEGDWMSQGMVDYMEADFHGGGSWNSPPRARGGGEWHPPPRNRSGEEWQPAPRERISGEWCSPSRHRASGDWRPPSRGRSPGMWPPECNEPGGVSRSPFKEGMDGGWPPGARKRRLSESPPRKRAGSRWGPPVEEQLPGPRGRVEERQPRRGRSPGFRPSPPRGRPDAGASFSGRRSPPGSRTEEFYAEKDRFHAEGAGGWQPDEGWRPMQGNPGHENWIGTGQERGGKFPSQEARGRRGSLPPDMQMEGNFPPEQRGDGGMRHFEIRESNLPPQEVVLNERFLHRGDIRGGRSMSPPRRMENEFPHEEARFSRHLSLKKERMDDSYPHEGRIDPDFPTQNQHLGGMFPRKEGGFPQQDGQFGTERVPFEERGNMPPLEGRMGRGFSPHGRRGNNFPPPERRMMGGLSIRERLGEKLDDMPPRESRPSRSLSPRERIRGHVPPNEDRMHHDVMRLESRMSDLPLRGGRIDEISPHMGRMREDRMVLIERTGGNSLPRENIMGDPHGGRIIGNFPPQEHRVGDLPPRDGRVGGGFASREPGDDFSPRGNRRGGDLAHQQHGTGYPFPHRESHGANLPSFEGRLDGHLLPPERMNADYPFHEGRMGRGDLQRGREIDDMPYGGRMSSDMPIGGGIGGNGPSHRGRPINEMPLQGNRGGSSDFPRGGEVVEFPPNRGRIEIDLPRGGRVGSGDFLPCEGEMIGDLPTGARIGNDLPPPRGRVGGAMPPHRGRHGGDMPQDRRGGDMPPFGGNSCGDLPLFVGRHDEFPSHRGKPSGDIPHHGRPGGDMPPDGRRYGGHLPPHGGRFDDEMPALEGKFGGDMPPHGGRIGDDVPPYGGDISREVGMPGDLHEGRSSSSDRWNRLPEKGEGPRKFAWMADQELNPNKGNIKREPIDIKREPIEIKREPIDIKRELVPAGRCEGGGPFGDWKPFDDHMQDRTSPMQQLHHMDNRNRENNSNHFHDKKQVSPNRKWTSPSRARRPGGPSPNRAQRRLSVSPPARSRMDQHARKQESEQPGDGRISPRRPMAGQRSPISRSDRFSPEGRRVIRQQSPVRGGGDNWRPLGSRHSGEWQPLERGNHGGESDRLPPNVDRSHHSPPRKQQRMEPDAGHRPNRSFPEGPDGRDSHGAGFPPIGNIDKMLEPTGRDLRDRILSSKEQHGPPFNPSSQLDTGPCGPGEQFLGKGGPVNESGPGWQMPHRAPPREDWQSPGSEGGGSRWERVPEEEDELAPYEIPFNQADWDSNDPHAGISYSASGHQPQINREDSKDERSRGSEGNRNQEAAGHPGSKTRGSVWQRVGGYVDDKKDSRERRGPSHYTGHSSSSGRGERGYRGGRDNKERNRGFEESRARRGRNY